jgi:SAM-dependent methyltransferase
MRGGGWDVEGVAEHIEAHWRSSPFEKAHAAVLGELCARYLTSRELSVVEVGCGTGRIYEQLVPRLLPDANYVGFDLSERMLALARRGFPSGDFRLGDGRALDLGDGAVDYALAFEVAGHLVEVGPLLRELGRVARHGFLFTVWPAAEEEGTVEEREHVSGIEFPHRRYPCSRLLSELAVALPGAAVQLEVAVLHADVWAYVVRHRCGGSPGVSMPRLVPIPGFAPRLLELTAAGRPHP